MRHLSSRDRYESQLQFLYTHWYHRFLYFPAEKMLSVEVLHRGLCVSGGLVANPVFHRGPYWQGSGCSSEGQSYVVSEPASVPIAF